MQALDACDRNRVQRDLHSYTVVEDCHSGVGWWMPAAHMEAEPLRIASLSGTAESSGNDSPGEKDYEVNNTFRFKYVTASQQQGCGAAPHCTAGSMCKPCLWPVVEDSCLLGEHQTRSWLLLCDIMNPTRNRLSPNRSGEVACDIVKPAPGLAAAQSFYGVTAVKIVA